MFCPKCGEAAIENARFCESCGTRLSSEGTASSASVDPERLPPCRCGAEPEAVDPQGFCTGCGIRRGNGLKNGHREPLPRDHTELDLAPHFAGVTDRGKKHFCNEDDLAMAMEEIEDRPVYLIVVCDGVSSSQHADAASAAGVSTALAALRQSLRAVPANAEQAMRDAILAAHQAVVALPFDPEGAKDAPGSTLVAALVQGQSAVIGWVGDSRAYRLDAEGAHPLTHDHSWINRVVDAGQMSEQEAETAPMAHAITQCLGLLDVNDPDELPEPSVVTVPLVPPCRLLLCTDGLWNYASHPEQIALLALEKPADAAGEKPEASEALVLARHLVDFALQQGGRDNITAVVLSLTGDEPAG